MRGIINPNRKHDKNTMAKGKKTGGRNFTGQPGPGRPRLPKAVKEARKLTKVEFESVVHAMSFMTRAELKAKMKDPTTTVLELMVGALASEAVNRGDHNRMEFIHNRMVGKVPDKVQHGGEDGGPIRYSDLSEKEIKARLQTILDRNKPHDKKPTPKKTK